MNKILKLLAIGFAIVLFAVSYSEANSAPEVTVIEPNGGESYTIGTIVKIKWLATDPDGDTMLRINISYWRFSSGRPVSIIEDTKNDGIYEWDTTGMKPGSYIIGVTAFDKQLADTDWSDGWFNLTSNLKVVVPVAPLPGSDAIPVRMPKP